MNKPGKSKEGEATEYRAKVFKSGNSLALRLPKALGLEEGAEMVLREVRQGYVIEPAPKKKQTIDVSGFWGKAPWLKPLPPELKEFEERPSTIAARKAKGEE
jgi:antitoxin VapB